MRPFTLSTLPTLSTHPIHPIHPGGHPFHRAHTQAYPDPNPNPNPNPDPNPNPNPNQAAIRFIVPMRKRPRVDQLFSSFESSAAGGHGAGLNLQL